MFYLFPVVVVVMMDLFGLDTATARQSAFLVDRFTAPFYESRAQSLTTVVLIDSDSLTRNQLAWPLRYGQYAALIDRVARMGARAVFVDLVWPTRRPDDPSFARLQRALAKWNCAPPGRGVPIFAAWGDGNPGQIHPDLRPFLRPAVTAWAGKGQGYPLTAPAAAPWTLCPDGTGGGRDVGKDLERTAAYALFRAACADGPVAAPDCPRVAPSDSAPPLHLRWGTRPPAGQQFLTGGCGEPLTLGRLVASSLHSILFWDEASLEFSGCPPVTTLTLGQLWGLGAQDNPLYREAVEGRVVLIGAFLSGTTDAVVSPVHGRMAGVYAHAVAFDNLITQGAAYVKEDVPLPVDLPRGPNLGAAELLQLTLLLAFAVIAAFARAHVAHFVADVHDPAAMTRNLDVRLEAWGVLIFTGAAAGAYAVWHLAPINWLGLIGGYTVIVVVLNEARYAWIRRLIRRALSAIRRLLVLTGGCR